MTQEPIPDEADEQPVGRHAAAAVGEQLRETADREAAEADLADVLDDEREAESEPDPTMQAIANANAKYIRAVIKAIGPDQPIAPCPHCSGLGFNSLELAPDQHRAQCAECQGRGMVATGSRVDGQHVLPCMSCRGNGWVTATPTITVPTAEGEQPVQVPELVIPQTVLTPASVVG